MAIQVRTRYKPDQNRTALETTVEGLDPATGDGMVIKTAQLIAYNDTQLSGANYDTGDPATEKMLVVLYQEPIGMSLLALGKMTQAQANTEWESALDDFGARYKPVAASLVRAALGAFRITPRALP